MGCSISTQTYTKEDNRPTTKLNDSNGQSTCEENHSVAENETIPDQSPLKGTKEDILIPKETLLNDFCQAEDKGTLKILLGDRTLAPEDMVEKEIASSLAEVDGETSSSPENDVEQQDLEKTLLDEGNNGEKVEGKMHTETAAHDVPETKEDETGERCGAAVTEIEEPSNKE